MLFGLETTHVSIESVGDQADAVLCALRVLQASRPFPLHLRAQSTPSA
jgi:hypothetical protein